MRKIYTLLTANGPRYAAFHSERDYFITPACVDIKHAAAAFAWTIEFSRENAAQYVLDVRPAAVERMEHGLLRLEQGQSLSAADALVVDCMYQFLHATVAPHQRDFRFLSDELLERWVQELGVRTSRMSDWNTHCVVHDGALWHAIHRPCSELKYPDMDDKYRGPREAPTRGQNVLTGRYLRTLAYIGKLIGPGRMSPDDIVAAWQGKNRTQALNCPSLLSQVIELLAMSPNFVLPPAET